MTSSRKKNDLPGWFPFAVVASGLIAIGAGIRSNWGRTQAAAPPPPDAQPPVQKASVLQGEWAGVSYRT